MTISITAMDFGIQKKDEFGNIIKVDNRGNIRKED